MKNTQIEESKVEEVKQPVIGKFKPKRKFISFISGLKAKVRLVSNSAFIKGEQLSGMVEGAIFKITICDEGTINFEEVDTLLSTPEMISRFIDDICDRDVTGYTEKFVVSGIEFYTEDVKRCYLEVEHIKPIDKLFSIFDTKSTVSDKGLSILNSLFGSDEPSLDAEDEVVKEVKAPVLLNGFNDGMHASSGVGGGKSVSQQMMEESFREMNESKVAELKDRVAKSTQEIKKYKYDIKTAETKLEETKESLKVLNTRLESLTPNDPLNGWVFYISQEIKSDIKPDEKMVEIIDKLSPLLKLNSKAVIDILTKGYYTIKITKLDDLECKSDYSSDEETKEALSIYSKISSIDLLGKFELKDKNTLEYRGELNWHQLISKMIRSGFAQNVKFDELSGSNSYESKTEEKLALDDSKHEDCGENCCGGADENCKCKKS